MKRLRFRRLSAITFILGLLIVGFQNCTQFKSGYQSKNSTQQMNNGEGYKGKGELYRHFDSQEPCADKDRDGQPLPNEQIFYQSQTPDGAREPYIVRDKCVDIAPQPINSADLKIEGNGKLRFNGREFDGYQATADFQILAAACPIGKTPIAGATRTNLIVNSQDWTEQMPANQGWMWHSGIKALLNGSIMSLPAYNIVRSDPAFPEEYRRIAQYVQLKSKTEYAFSFLAKKGTRDSINFRYYRKDQATGNEEYLNLAFNLSSGTSSVRWNWVLAPPRITMTPVGEGFFCTVYFTTGPNAGENYSDFGFAPAEANGVTQTGDSVYATAAQLEETSGFCQ